MKSAYRGGFGRLARLLRRINETAYGISILFLMLACVGFALQAYSSLEVPAIAGTPQADASRDLVQGPQPGAPQTRTLAVGPVTQSRLTTIGISGIVLLNLVRLAAGLANLVVIPFRRSPLQGVLFLIPPLTFFYIWRRWAKLEQPVMRVVGPVVALALVVAAYTFLPGLRPASRSEASLHSRVGTSMRYLKRDVTRQIEETRRNVNSLKRELPRHLEQAQKGIQRIQRKLEKGGQVQGADGDNAPGQSARPTPNSVND